jgi:hypothetical protein
MGGNPIQLDYTFLFTLFFPIVVSLIFSIFAVYLMVSALRHFKHQAAFDQALLLKLDELIKLQTQQPDRTA